MQISNYCLLVESKEVVAYELRSKYALVSMNFMTLVNDLLVVS